MAHAGPEHLDPAYVDGYDRKQGHPDPSDDIALLGEHGIGPASTVVDLGAGTGRFALAIAPQVSRVVAVDVSAAMRAHIAAADPTVDVVAAGFLTYRHDGGPADAVYTRNALHQIPDLFKALALQRIAEMLRPGGVLLLRDLVFDAEPAELPGLVGRWFSGAVRDPARGYTAEEYAEHLRTEFSTFRWLLEPMLQHAAFDLVQVEHEGPIYGRYLCRGRGANAADG